MHSSQLFTLHFNKLFVFVSTDRCCHNGKRERWKADLTILWGRGRGGGDSGKAMDQFCGKQAYCLHKKLVMGRNEALGCFILVIKNNN